MRGLREMKWTGDGVTGSEGTAAEPHFAAPGRGLARSASPAVLQDRSPRYGSEGCVGETGVLR